MKSRSLLTLIAGLAPSAALADVLTQTVPFDYSANDGISFPIIQGFDTLGGTRQLQGVTFEFRHNFEMDLFVESTGPTPVAASDWSVSLSYITLYQIGESGGEPPPPFFGPGALFIENASGDLGAYDGVPGNDGPDSYRRIYTDSFTVTQQYGPAEQDVLDAVTRAGPITTLLGGFTELFFAWNNDPNWPIPPGGVPEYPTDAAIWTSTPTFRHFGEIVLTYDYVPVPAPAGAAVAALGSLALSRRRRR